MDHQRTTDYMCLHQDLRYLDTTHTACHYCHCFLSISGHVFKGICGIGGYKPQAIGSDTVIHGKPRTVVIENDDAKLYAATSAVHPV